MGHVFMDAYLLWLLVGSIACALVGGLGYRAWRRMQAKRRSERAAVEAATWAEAQRLAAAKAARHRHRQELAAQEAVRAEASRLAQAEAARAEAADLADAEVARVQAARAAAEAAALEHAARLAAGEAARARVALAAAEDAARLEIERQATALAAAQAAATLVAKTPAQTLVMVADDSKVVRVKTGRLLAQHQYRVTFATDGLDAVNQMRTSMPDVVITDVDMPGMDGFELTRHVRQNPLTAHIPVIMITAADDKHRQDADRAGVSVLLGKPYPEDELIAHIRQAMKHDELAAAATA